MLELDPLNPVSLPLLSLPLVNGVLSSIALESYILTRPPSSFPLEEAVKTACGMSLISMVSMELAMEGMDYVGGWGGGGDSFFPSCVRGQRTHTNLSPHSLILNQQGLTGGMQLQLWAMPAMLAAGFVTP